MKKMAEKFVIQGGKQLDGEIEVLGAKNAALPILAATLLIPEDCVICNLPRIQDVLTMLEIIEGMGAKVIWRDEREIVVNTVDLNPEKLKNNLIGKFRGSVLLLGPLLARFSRVRLPFPGGCLIGNRPIDTHLDALSKLGVRIYQDQTSCSIAAEGKVNPPEEIVLKEFSVTATENILLALSLTPKKTRIKIAASDYQVQDLCRFLRKAGVKIKHTGFHTIEIEGQEKLAGTEHYLVYDPIEAGTFIITGALNKGKIIIKNVFKEHLDLFLEKLKEFNVNFEVKNQLADGSCHGPLDDSQLVTVSVFHSRNLKASKVQVLPPPGLYPDLQPLFGLLATQASGTSLIHDPMYEARFGYLPALKQMGADVVIADPHRAMITGPTKLSGIEIPSFDLRSGATLIIAGLIAQGMTIINDAYQVDRGYERIEERLRGLGADIKRISA